VLAELAVPFVNDQFGEVANRLRGIKSSARDSVVETQRRGIRTTLWWPQPAFGGALFSDFGPASGSARA